jgi:drug/metabolite transporter (DMT)-like permease
MRFFLLRGAVHSVGVILWFYAMARIPMAEVTAMNYLAPVYVTLGAGLFLGEKLAARRLIAVGVALLGALVILRPGFREVEPGHLAMLGTGLMLGISYLIAKRSSGRFDPAVVVGMLSLLVTLGLLPFAAAVWVPPTAVQVGWLFVVAGLATGAHYTMTLAFAAAPVSVTQPVTFLQLIWAVLIGWFVFGEPLDGWVVLGGAMIIAAISYITWREAMLKRRIVTPSPNETKV